MDARVDAGVVPDAKCVSNTTTKTLLGARDGGTGQASMADTFIVSSHLALNYGTAPTLALCAACDASGTPWNNATAIALLYFDVAAICPGSTVMAAELLLDTTDDNLGSGSVGVFVMREDWTEGNGPSFGSAGAANWIQSKPNANWMVPGAGTPDSRDATPIANFAPSGKSTSYSVPLAPSALQSWFTAGGNHGLALAIVSQNSDVQFHSRESTTVAKRPGLELTTRAP